MSPDRIREGADVYGRILGLAGGREVRAVDVGGAIAVGLYASPAYDLQLPPLDASRLSINLTASHVSGGVDGERGRAFVARRHSLFLTPAGAATRWEKGSPSRHLNIYFSASAAGEGGHDLGRELQRGGPIFNLLLPGSGALIERLETEMSSREPFRDEAIQSLVLLLLVELWRRRARRPGPGTIPAASMARLEEHVAAHLGERIAVADLARVAGMPEVSFASAFVRSTGRSPYQHVLWRRVERAAAMLRSRQGSLAEVAAACGFSSQQHMTHVLRSRLGATPAALRGAAPEARRR